MALRVNTDPGAIRFNNAQSLSNEQLSQALANLKANQAGGVLALDEDGFIPLGSALLKPGQSSEFGATNELLLQVAANSGNVLVLRNTGATNAFSAIVFDAQGAQEMAVGTKASTDSSAFWNGRGYIEMCNATGVPRDFMLAMDGDYGSGFAYCARMMVYATDGFDFNRPAINDPEYDDPKFILRMSGAGNMTQGFNGSYLTGFSGSNPTNQGLNIWLDGKPGGIAIVGNGQTNGSTLILAEKNGTAIIGNCDSTPSDNNRLQIQTGLNAGASDVTAGGTPVLTAANGRIRFGNMSYTLGYSAFLPVQIGFESGNVSGLTIVQNGVATANQGFAAASNTYVVSADGAAISWQSGANGSLTGGTEKLNLNLSSGLLTLKGALRLANAAVSGTVTPDHTITIQDSTGTTYRVPCLV